MMIKTIQVMLIAWFIVVNLFIFIPSYKILKGIYSDEAVMLPKAPDPPSPPAIGGVIDPNMNRETQQEVIKAYVSFYTQNVAAHNQQIDAYKKQLESLGKTRQSSVYELVIKQTITALITGLTTALVAFAFAKTAELVRLHFQSRASARETPISRGST
jgi:hypothetical protein